MKKLLIFLITTALALGTPFVALSASDELKKIYEDAKKEGEVSYWTESDPDEISLVIKTFESKYPGIKVKHFEIDGNQMMERVILESKARKTSWDVLETDMSKFFPLYERDLLEKVEWTKIFGLPKEALCLDDLGVVTYHLAYTTVYNTDIISKEEAPKTYDDLLLPKWKDKIVIEMRGGLIAGLALAWGEEKTDNYVKKLLEQNPLLVKGGTTVIQTVGSGERPIGMGTFISKVPFWEKKGLHTDWMKAGPVFGASYTAMIPKNPMHPNAAMLFAGFYGTEEAQKALESAAYKSSIKPESGTALAIEIKNDGLGIVVTETKKDAETLARLRKKYTKMLGGMK